MCQVRVVSSVLFFALFTFLCPFALGEDSALLPKTALDLFGDPLPLHATARMGTVRFRPREGCWASAISPDGKTVATGVFPGSYHSALELWDASTGKLSGTLLEGTNNVLCLTWSPDSRLLTVGHDYRAEIWDVVLRKPVRDLQPPDDAIGLPKRIDEPLWTRRQSAAWDLCWSSDGKWIVGKTNHPDYVVVWDAVNGNVVHRSPSLTEVEQVAISKDGTMFASGGTGAPHIWSTASFEEVDPLANVGHCVTSVAFSPDGKTIVGGIKTAQHESAIQTWNIATGKATEMSREPGKTISHLAYSPDEGIIFSASFETSVRLWNADTLKPEGTLDVPGLSFRCLSFSEDGKKLATAERGIAVWDVEKKKLQFDWDAHRAGVFQVAIAPDGKTAISAGGDRTLRWWDISTGKQIRQSEIQSGSITGLAVYPDDRSLASVTDGGQISLWNIENGKLIKSISAIPKNANAHLRALTFSPDGKDIVHSGYKTSISAWILSQNTIAGLIEHAQANHLEYSPDGTLLAWSELDAPGRIHLWDFSAQNEIGTFPGDATTIHGAFAFSPNGKTLAARADAPPLTPAEKSVRPARKDNYLLRLWNVATRQTVWSTERLNEIGCVAFSPDGKLLATADGACYGKSSFIRLWSADDGQLLMEMSGHQEAIRSIAFTQDGTHLLSASQDTTLLVWDIEPARQKLSILEKSRKE